MTKTEFKSKWAEVIKILYASMEELKVNTFISPIKPYKVSEKEGILYFSCVNSGLYQSLLDRYEKNITPAILKVFEKNYKISIIEPNDEDEEEEEEIPGAKDDSRLNPEYTFNTFVTGKTNQFALAASFAVAEGYSKQYNPLFIYGGSGLGKTHLMHAIGQYVIQNRPKKKVRYVSSEMFTNELIYAIQNKTTDKFRNKYRKVDYLLFDDVQFIEGKESTEEELFHTFEELYNSGKQIVFTSDKPPKDLGDIPERLKSRFAWGMPVDIQAPDYETRMAILKNKAILDDLDLDENLLGVLEVIAQNIQNNIRELEGAYNRVVSFSNFTGEKISKEVAKKALSEIFKTSKKEITPTAIKECVAKQFGIKLSDIESSNRSRSIAYPRQIAIYLIREICDYSYPEIGDLFGGRDHSTIIHSYEKIKEEYESNKELKNKIDNIKFILEDQ